jgi:hypothetical protein
MANKIMKLHCVLSACIYSPHTFMYFLSPSALPPSPLPPSAVDLCYRPGSSSAPRHFLSFYTPVPDKWLCTVIYGRVRVRVLFLAVKKKY